MNKYIVIIIVSLGLLGLGGMLFISRQSETVEVSNTILPTTVTVVQTEKSILPQSDTTNEGTMMVDEQNNPRYIPYSESEFRANASVRRVLFFYASWCPTCRPADSEFTERMSEIPEDVQLIRVNYNDPDTDEDEKALAEKYTVTYQHTYVQIDALGKQVAKWNGGVLNELLANIK